MKTLMVAVAVAVVALLGVAEAAFAQAEQVQRVAEADWHSGAYDAEKGTNFADPNGYKRFIAYQGAGADGAAGDSGDGAAAGDGGATGGDGGNGTGGEGEGCSK